ncbi:MAG: GspE/PulE family protein [Candidatus Omnitrophica bacterium]|nr:GspE/PulE family protein [Candidatus Omnitrophota bacterium]
MPELNLEESIIKEGILSAQQLQTVKIELQRSSITLVEAIRRLRFVPEDTLLNFLSSKLNLKVFNSAGYLPDKDILALLPIEFLWEKKVAPLSKENDELTVGVLDPLNGALLEELRFRTGFFIRPCLIKEEDLNSVLAKFYDRRSGLRAAAKEESVIEKVKEEGSFEPSAIEAANLLLIQAIKFNASDVHIEPQSKDKMSLRLRIDGVLKEISPPDSKIFNAFISRIKIMSNLDIAERRLPQDGRFSFTTEDSTLDVRVSVIPTIQGESIVLRLLRQNKKLLSLQELGMSKENFEKYRKFIQRPSGIILVTGPTGSGKSTTLYASLLSLQSVEKNIITIEDPVEYQLDFGRQIQVNHKINLVFATGLRSILRHDPDIIMVGEIRDLETATIAIQAALTGHLVLSSLHTNDAASAVTRLIDMGIEPFLIASCLNGVVGQRLIRVLCPKCKKPKVDTSNDPAFAAITSQGTATGYETGGCQDCLNTGFSGRLGIFEVMEMTPQIGRKTVDKASSDEINELCRKDGMRFLHDDGLEKVLAGSTTPQELLRVIGARISAGK